MPAPPRITVWRAPSTWYAKPSRGPTLFQSGGNARSGVPFTPANVNQIVALGSGADQLFIEAAFANDDADVALERQHLTAAQAVMLARTAGAKRLTTFHHSPRYLETPDRLRQEAEAAFGAAVSDTA